MIKTKTTDIQTTKSSGYVIGIGASAGGMDVIHEIFDNLPADTGFSFVIIQHLSPDYKSLLAELLSRHTMMKVFEASDNLKLESNSVYVIPSKKILTIENDRIRLSEKTKTLPNNAIDIFFSSLAEQKKEKAVGIILSGTGSDGSKGIVDLKKNGGLVIIQDPATAAFDGMPTSAINTGSYDLILSPDMIADEIGYLLGDSGLKTFSPFILNSGDEAKFTEILQVIKSTSKFDFSLYKRPTLYRRLSKRMSEAGMNSVSDYLNFLRTNEDEVLRLSQEFLINVTRFFRDREAFKEIQNNIIPQLADAKKDGELLKIWCVACSTGEEAYTLAMICNEYFRSKNIIEPKFKIFATDIDSKALEVAAQGIYKKDVINDVPAEYLERYFLKEGELYRVSPSLRKMIVFAHHDVLKDPPFSKLDLITCRNLLIYLTPILQKTALSKFHFAMNVDSVLMLGPSENIGHLKETMTEVNRKWKIYKCNSKRSPIDRDFLISPLTQSNLMQNRNPSVRKNVSPDNSGILTEVLCEDRSLTGVFVDSDFNVRSAFGRFRDFLKFPEENFNLSIFKMVPQDLSLVLSLNLRRAMNQEETIKIRNFPVKYDEGERRINIIIKPESKAKTKTASGIFILLENITEYSHSINLVPDSISSSDKVIELERQLALTRENLQEMIDEMDSVNEEMTSNNEEIVSANEELQSTNEELQSLNEELHTVNAEHQIKIKELIDLNDDLDNYFKNSDTGQILIDNNLIIRKFNPIVTQMINLIGNDIGRSISDISTNIKSVDLMNDIKEVIRNSNTIEKEFNIDSERYFLMRINPYIRKDKTKDGAVISFFDITHARNLTSMLEGVFNSSPNGIVALKTLRNAHKEIINFEVVSANITYAKIFGFDRSKLLGRTIRETDPHAYNTYMKLFVNCVESGQQSRMEFYSTKYDKWYELIVVKMLDGIICTYIDITERKKAADIIADNYEELKKSSFRLKDMNEQLERSNFDLMQFASVASHDLKEPLRKIQTFGNILQSRIKDKLADGDLNYLQKMISASGRMQTLIEDVLTLSKLSNNRIPLTLVNLHKIVKRILDDLEITIKEKNAVITLGPLPNVLAVPGQMHQMFLNLITNALKFTDKETPKILITECKPEIHMISNPEFVPEKFLCIQVIDNGIGFEEEYVEKIFGIFQRLHGRQFDGTGIGLAITKKIIENHHGFIVAEGEPGKGATFTILLPKGQTNGHVVSEQEAAQSTKYD